MFSEKKWGNFGSTELEQRGNAVSNSRLLKLFQGITIFLFGFVFITVAIFSGCDDSPTDADNSDTTFVYLTDTLFISDTFHIADTFAVVETLTVFDTLFVSDTIFTAYSLCE